MAEFGPVADLAVLRGAGLHGAGLGLHQGIVAGLATEVVLASHALTKRERREKEREREREREREKERGGERERESERERAREREREQCERACERAGRM